MRKRQRIRTSSDRTRSPEAKRRARDRRQERQVKFASREQVVR